MSGFLAIPRAALAAVGRDRDARYAVQCLWERADEVGYAPLLVTDRELSDAWGVSRRAVWTILEQLEAAGQVELDRAAPGSKRRSRVVVRSAVRSGARNEPETSQSASQNDRPPMRTIRESVPDREPEPSQKRARYAPDDPLPVAVSDPPIDETRDKRSPPPAPRAREAGADPELAEDVAYLVELQQGEEPQPDTAADAAAARRALLGGWTVAEVAALWAWSGVSDHPQAQACRGGAWRRLASLLKRGPHLTERREAARAWDAAGRPTGPPARAAPARASPRNGARAARGRAGDGVLEGLLAKIQEEEEEYGKRQGDRRLLGDPAEFRAGPPVGDG